MIKIPVSENKLNPIKRGRYLLPLWVEAQAKADFV